MDVWLIWLIIAVVLGIAEILTLTAALGILGVAALVTAVGAAVGIPFPIQLLVFAAASTAGIVFIRPVVREHLTRPSVHVFGPAAHAGKTARVVREIHGENGQVRIDGEDWSARTYDESLVIPVGAVVDVLEIKGVIALVYPKEQP
jgi:membrane protein implicated in regulation of membrane protease activity